MTAWRVADDAKNSRIEPHPGMAEPVAQPRAPIIRRGRARLYR